MTLRQMALLIFLAGGLTGCGPKADPTIGGVEPTEPAKMEGVWMISKVEVAGDDKPPTDDELKGSAVSIKGNLFIAKKKGEKETKYMKFELDEKANPKTFTLTESDEKGEPKKGPGDKGEPLKLKGIYSLDGDTMKWAMCPVPDAPLPTDFTPKAPTKKITAQTKLADEKLADVIGTQVMHFTRQKELPDWAK